MTNDEMFDSAVRSAGDKAGVFEYDGETGYFYLYDTRNESSRKVIAAIPLLVGTPDFEEKDITIRWDPTESMAGLFIRGQLWAVFDGETGTQYGGHYRAHACSEMPVEIINAFEAQEDKHCLDD